MRIFVKLGSNNIVVSQVESDRIPGDGINLPANIIEVTDRSDGPWLGKVWNPTSQTFEVRALTKEDYKSIAFSKYSTWQQAKETLAGAQTHNEAAGVITFLTNQESTAWSNYKAAIQDWIQAP